MPKIDHGLHALLRAAIGQHDLAFPAGGALFASEGGRAGNMASANRAE
jgi:hypothetical protein